MGPSWAGECRWGCYKHKSSHASFAFYWFPNRSSIDFHLNSYVCSNGFLMVSHGFPIDVLVTPEWFPMGFRMIWQGFPTDLPRLSFWIPEGFLLRSHTCPKDCLKIPSGFYVPCDFIFLGSSVRHHRCAISPNHLQAQKLFVSCLRVQLHVYMQ